MRPCISFFLPPTFQQVTRRGGGGEEGGERFNDKIIPKA